MLGFVSRLGAMLLGTSVGRRLRLWLAYAAILIAALAATPAQAVTFPCSVGPGDLASLHFTNAGDGSFQDIGLTGTNIANAPTSTCFGMIFTTTLAPVGGVRTLGNYPDATSQHATLGHPAADTITYQPPSTSFSGTDTFDLDVGNVGRVIHVTVTVDAPKPVATPFTASAIPYNTGSASASPIDLSGHVTFSPTSYAVGSGTTAQGGTVSVNSSGIASYKPLAGFRGNDSFTFTATNGSGTSNSVTVTVPVSNPTLTIGLSSTTGTIGAALSGVTITASGGKASYSCATTPVTGSLPAGVALASNCTLSGTPTTAATATFTVNVTDSSTGTGPFTQQSGTLSFTVAKAASATALVSNNNPSIQNANVTFTATVTGTGTPTGTVTFKDSSTTLGTGTLSGGAATYSTTALAVGDHTITANYGGDASNAASTSSTLTQTVNLPAAPTVSPTSASVTYNTAKAIDLSALISGVHTSIAVASGPAHGSTSVSGDVVTYTPTGGYFGSDSFTYTATGPGGTSTAATVTITVSTPPAPTVAAASATVTYDTPRAIDLSGSITGAHTSIAVASGPAHGTTSVSGDVVTYTPTSGYVGGDSFTYTATGPGGTSSAATVTLTVAAPPAPTVSAASASVSYNTPKAIDLSGSITGVHTSIAVASGPAHGTTSVSGDVVTYTPTAGYIGGDSFTYTATGPGGTSAAATVTLTVAAPPAPIVSAASATVTYEIPKPIDLSGSIGGVHTSIAVASGPAHGTTSISGDVVTYTPTSGYFGSDSFTYTATGPGGTSSAATVSITVSPPAAPSVAAASASVTFNTAKAIDLSASITGVHTSIAVASGPAHGTTSVAGDVVTYTPTSGYFGADSFTYTATGPGGTSSAATVTITVSTPPAPTVSAASASVSYNTAKAIDLSASVTGVHTSIAVASGPAHGTTSVAGDVVTYTPTSGYIGGDSFTYTATGPGGTSAAATVAITVAAPPAPTVSAASASVAYNTAKAIDLSGSITGFHTSIAVASGPAHGTTSVASDVVTYTPTSGYFGADSFTYTATGPGGTSAAATVTITVATPGAPTVAPASAAVTYNTAKAIDLSASITGVHSSITVASGPAHGTTSVAGDVVTYTPTAGYFGADSFTYTATGPGGTSASATVSITVGNPPAPTVAAASATAAFNTATPIDLSASITGVHTAIAVASAPAHGTTSVSGDVVTYTPSAGYSGTDSFTYTATGPGGTSSAATVSITVGNPPAPTVAAASATVTFNTAKAIDLSASITGVHTSIAVASAPTHGTTSVAADVVTYTPTAGYFGADSFTYTATGPGGTSAAATVTITVATPAAPTAAAASASVTFNTAKAIDLSASITGVHTAIAVASGPAHGTTSVAGDIVTYTPTSGYIGGDSFTYTATGPGGTSTAATVTITVAASGIPSVAPASASVTFNTAKAIDLSGSITGAHSAITVASAPAHGTTSVSGDTVTYTPTAGYSGADSFTYTATGPGGTSSAATVSITVGNPPAPTVAAASATVTFNTAKAIDLSASITGVHTSIAVASAPTHGTTSVAGDIVTYTPTSGYSGSDSFTYTATGPGGTSAAATVTITVAASGVPIVAPKAVSTAYNTPIAINLAASITGTHSAIAVASVPTHGNVSVAGDIVTYTPAGPYIGSDSFTYTATGPGGVSTPATVTITITPPPAPTVTAASATIKFGTPTQISLASHITGLHNSTTIVSAPTHGTTTIAGDIVTYTPAAGYSGTDSFTYSATGPGGTATAATVSITVSPAVPPQVTPLGTQVTSSPTQSGTVGVNLSNLVTGDYTEIIIVTPPRHGTVTLTGSAPGQAPAKESALPSERAPQPGIVAIYTPNPGFVGSDSFAFIATGPGGSSAPAEVSITVLGSAPVAQPKTATTIDNQRVSIDLTAGATNGPFTGAMLVSTSPADSADATIVQGGTAEAPTYRLDVTPKPHFGGRIVVTYQLKNAFGMSAASTATITVTARPDPSADPRIRAISDAQAETARDFSRTQVENFMRRTEDLHGRGGHRSDMGARLALDALIGRTVADDPRDNNRPHGLDILSNERPRGTTDASGDAAAAGTPTKAAAGGGGGSDGNQMLAVWTGGALELGQRDATSNRARMHVATSGLSGGADMKVANGLILGLGGGYAFNVTKLPDDGGRVSGHSAIGAAYFSATPTEGSFIDGVGGYGDIRFHTRRTVTETGDIARGSRDGTLGFLSFSTGIDRTAGKMRWSVYGRGDYERAVLDSYTESDADLYDLRFGRRVVRSLTSVVGGKLSLTMPMAGGSYMPSIRAEWSHEFDKSGRQTVDYADIAGPGLFGIETLDWGREEYSLALANQFNLSSWSIGTELSVRAAEKERSGTLRVMLKKKF